MSEPVVLPDRDTFHTRATSRRVISVHTRVSSDDLTPVVLYQLLCSGRELTYLLESAQAGVWSRYSIVGVSSASTLIESGGMATWLGREIVGTGNGDPLQVLHDTLALLQTEGDEDLPPFHSGFVGYLGYDTVRRLEYLPRTNPDDLGLPEMVMMLASDLAVLDHEQGEVWLIANAVNFDGTPQGVDQAYQDAVSRVQTMADRLLQPRPVLSSVRPSAADAGLPPITRSRTAEEFEQMVVAAQEEIRAGEAFQIVVSQRFSTPFDGDPFEIYRSLRVTNPSPYLYFLNLPGFTVIGSSPESLVGVQHGVATTRPIAGTRRRGRNRTEDQRLADELRADPKERAEHIMLVDLGRNDLGRVCVPGSVTVNELMKVRNYSHVMHMEAEVTGEIATPNTALDVTLACFPAGTLSGAPKVRAMEIIDRLETTCRGVYGGAVGYFDFAGNSDVAIAIRTAVTKDGQAHIQAGAGVVADSIPKLEEMETRNKAAAVLTAIARANGTAPLRTAGGMDSTKDG